VIDMLVKVEYFGFYPLGADRELYNVPIMKAEWNIYNKAVFTYGKKNVVSPFLGQLYYVKYNESFVFFVAIEQGLGHYRIFSTDEKNKHKTIRKNQIIIFIIYPRFE
jgi:hypothetical protein